MQIEDLYLLLRFINDGRWLCPSALLQTITFERRQQQEVTKNHHLLLLANVAHFFTAENFFSLMENL